MIVPRQKNTYASQTARRPATEHLAGMPGRVIRAADRALD